MKDFGDFMRGMEHAQNDRTWKPYADSQTMIDDLLDEKAIRDNGASFKEGDIVTPREGVNIQGRGLPHMVLATYETKYKTFKEGGMAAIHNMALIVRPTGGEFCCFENDQKQFELFDPKKNYTK